jgi:hypothetical protein
MDGMMSLETVERFWGEPQVNLPEELSRRGFKIYNDAMLIAGGTTNAVRILFSPAFSDSFFEGRLLEELELYEAERIFHELMWATTVSSMNRGEAYYEHFELINALLVRGYILESTSGHLQGFFNIGRAYLGRFPVNFFFGPLSDLLTATTPFRFLQRAIAAHTTVESRLLDFRYDPLARFVFEPLYYTHIHHLWRQDPALLRQKDLTAVHLYPLAFDYTAQRMLSLVDNVLEENPSAVIVLQADHGFHTAEVRQLLLDQGYTPEQVLELYLSVFSAVRIPAQYGGLEAPIAPLNISRELVNRFVGQNYNLLP